LIDKSASTKYISLTEASKLCNYSQEYLSLRARQGKLRAVKLGRNWVTTKEWLSEYLESVATSQTDEVMIAGSAARKSGPHPTSKKYLAEKHRVSQSLNAIYGHCLQGLKKFFSFRLERLNCRLADLARITMVVVSIGILACLAAEPSVRLVRNEAREAITLSQEVRALSVEAWSGARRFVIESVVSLREFSPTDNLLKPGLNSVRNLAGIGSKTVSMAINWGRSLPDKVLSGLENRRLSLVRNFKTASHNFVFVSRTGLEVITDAYGQAPDNISVEWLAMTRNLSASMILGANLAKDRLTLGAEKFNFALSGLRQRAQGLTAEDGIAAIDRFLVSSRSASLSLATDLEQTPSEIYLSAKHLRAAMTEAAGSGIDFLLIYRTGAKIVLEAYENAPENILLGWETIESRNQLAKERLTKFASATASELSGLGRRTTVFVQEKAAKGARVVIAEAGKTMTVKANKVGRQVVISFFGWTNRIANALTRSWDVAVNSFNFWRGQEKYDEVSDVKMPVESVKKGIVVVPSTDNDEEVKRKIRNNFSDEVKVEIQDKTSGIITPVFREGDGDRYLYMMVPIQETN
jgi:hypothetical protein